MVKTRIYRSTRACIHKYFGHIILFTSRYQLELKEEYISRSNKVTEDEKKNKGNRLSEFNKVAVYSIYYLGSKHLLLKSNSVQ